jgi:hypothetical protein
MSWTEQQDATLRKCIDELSCEKCNDSFRPDCPCETFKKKKTWETIAKKVGKTYGSCQARWNGHLDPYLYLEPWSPEEEQIMKEIYADKKTYNTWVKRALRLQELTKNPKRRNGGIVCLKCLSWDKKPKKRVAKKKRDESDSEFDEK